MEKQNVTIQLPKELLREARHIAIGRGLSLSGYLAELVSQAVHRERAYSLARERQVSLMEQGLNLGTGGRMGWKRDDLHAR